MQSCMLGQSKADTSPGDVVQIPGCAQRQRHVHICVRGCIFHIWHALTLTSRRVICGLINTCTPAMQLSMNLLARIHALTCASYPPRSMHMPHFPWPLSWRSQPESHTNCHRITDTPSDRGDRAASRLVEKKYSSMRTVMYGSSHVPTCIIPNTHPSICPQVRFSPIRGWLFQCKGSILTTLINFLPARPPSRPSTNPPINLSAYVTYDM